MRRAGNTSGEAREPRFRLSRRGAARAGVAVTLMLVAIVFAWIDRSTPERANRLYRRGEVVAAIDIQRRLVESTPLPPEGGYNLGTMWLALGAPARAEEGLRLGLVSETPEVRFRSSYNLGLLLLNEGLKLNDREMAASLVGESVLAFREALRMGPDSDATRWNLAIAMATLDSLTWRAPGEENQPPGREVPLELVRTGVAGSGEAIESPESANMLFSASVPGPGARELLASELESGSFRMEDVDHALRSLADDPGLLLDRILRFEGPRGASANDPAAGRW